MKRKILSCILMGALVLSLSACGEDTSTTNDSIATDTTQENEVVESIVEELENPSERSEEELEEMVEEANSVEVADMFKPAFEAHPLFKGNIVVCGTMDEVIEAFGEPTSPNSTEALSGYIVENSAGASFEGKFVSSTITGPEGSTIGAANNYVTTVETSEYFDVDNDYYTVTNDAFSKMQVIFDETKANNYGGLGTLTYEDIVEVFGTPGYIYKVDGMSRQIDTVYVLWVNPEADGENSHKYMQIEFMGDTGHMGFMFEGESIYEVSGTLR